MSYSKKTDWSGAMITTAGLLYVNPVNRPSDEPLIDDLTIRMAEALRQHIRTGVLGQGGKFHEGFATRGVHRCSCGIPSSNVDYQLSNGMVTNALAAHYLAWHRDEVPPSQLLVAADLPRTTAVIDMEATRPPKKWHPTPS